MELKSAQVRVVDFVEGEKREELESALRKITNREGKLSARYGAPLGIGIPLPTYNRENWGPIDLPLQDIEKINVDVYFCNDFPIYFVSFTGIVKLETLKKILDDETDVSFASLQSQFEKSVEPMLKKIPGVISTLQNNYNSIAEVEIKADEKVLHSTSNKFVSLPFAIITFNGLEEIFGKEEKRTIESSDITEFIRKNKLFNRFNLVGLTSVTEFAENTLGIVSQINAIKDNYGISHSGYVFLYFSKSREDKILSPKDEIPSPSSWTFLSIDRMLPLLCIIYWLRSQAIKSQPFEEQAKKILQLSTEKLPDSLKQTINELSEKENKFFKEYLQFLDKEKYARNCIGREKNLLQIPFYAEHPLPAAGLVDMKSGKPLQIGVFENLVQDAEIVLEGVKGRYGSLKDQYKTTIYLITPLINLNISSINLRLQKILTAFTIFLFVLTVILVFTNPGILTGILGWFVKLFEWFSSLVNRLI